jgi:hypothetical protein
MHATLRYLLYFLMLPTLYAGCGWIMDGEDLRGCAQQVRIAVDWSHYHEELPEGMSLILYADGSNVPTLISTNELSHVLTTLEPGTYHTAVINYSPDEFRHLQFVDMHSMITAFLTTTEVSNPWYKPTRVGETVREQPEAFGYDADTYLEVTPELFATEEAVPTLTHLQPTLITRDVEVQLSVNGVDNISRLRAALTGMAAGYYPGLQRTSLEVTTYLTDEWTLTRASGDASVGTLTAHINTFGCPVDHEGEAEENRLLLQVTRTDGEIYNYEYPVGHQLDKTATRLYVAVSDSIRVEPPASQRPGSQTGSAFDADVSDWSEAEDWSFDM